MGEEIESRGKVERVEAKLEEGKGESYCTTERVRIYMARLSGWPEGLWWDGAVGLQSLEVGEGRRGVPAVLYEAEVRERVGEVGGVHHLEHDTLLLVRL